MEKYKSYSLVQRMEELSKQGDPLERLNSVIKWEEFRSILEKVARRKDRSKGGRPPYDHILMFKILILQTFYNLSDDQTEYQIRDRLSFMRFLGLSLEDTVPDAKTLWVFREKISKNNGIIRLFRKLDQMLINSGYVARSGQIVDASIIAAPKRRVPDKDKKIVKKGHVPKNWSKAKMEQTDVNAKWTLKGSIPYFGYKNHINIDKKYRFIRRWRATDAALHDSRVFKPIFDLKNCGLSVFADTAYRSKKTENFISKHKKVSKILWKKPPKKELSSNKKQSNIIRNRIRGVVEHVFSKQKAHMKLFIRTIGIKRARFKIGMANLVYNFSRLEFLQRKGILPL